MKEVDVSNALNQLRMNFASAKSPNINETNEPKVNFSDLLQQSIDKVNDLQQQSGELSKAFEIGDPNVSLAEVMIASQKAGIAFQSVVQVRNKLLTAYKEIMSMQV